VDRHVARWRDHWIDIHFDDEVEAAVERIGAIARYLRSTKKDALAVIIVSRRRRARSSKMGWA